MRRTFAALKSDVGQMLNPRISLYVVLTSIIYIILLPAVHASGISIEQVYLTLVGGFDYEEIIAFKLDELFIWTLLSLSYLMGISGHMQSEYSGRCKDTLYRFSSYRTWYANKALSATLVCIGVSLLVSLGVVLGSLLWGVHKTGAQITTLTGFYEPAWPYCFLAFAMLTLNMVMMTQWQMTIHLLSGNIVLTTAAFLLPIIFSLYGASNTYLSDAPLMNPINWGMMFRSDLFSDPGFPLLKAIIGQLLIAAACFGMGLITVPYVNMAGRANLKR